MCKNDAAKNSEHLQASKDQNKEVINNSTMISCGPMISVLPYIATSSIWRHLMPKKTSELGKKKIALNSDNWVQKNVFKVL